MRAKHSADNPVTRSPAGPPHSPTEHTVGGGRDDGCPRDPWSCCACAAPGAPACRAGVRCNSVRKNRCPRQSMLRELLYPRAMAGPSLPGHPPQTPNNARCPPQPPSAYILVRGASLFYPYVYTFVSRIHPHPDSAAGTHNIVQILGRVSTCFLLKLLLIPPCRGLCWKRDCGGDANEKDGAAGRPRFRRRAGIGRRFGGEFSASC